MKIDKEMLIKHHFWALLGGFLLAWAIAFVWILLQGSSEAEAAQKQFETSQNGLKPFKTPGAAVNPTTYLPPWKTFEAHHSAHKQKVWKEAWEFQKKLIAWPVPESSKAREEFDFQDRWNASASFQQWKDQVTADQSHLEKALGIFQKLYPKQFEDLDLFGKVAPVEYKGGKAGFESMMVPPLGTSLAGAGNLPGKGGFQPGPGRGQNQVNKTPGNLFKDEIPTLEEAWLAQEDFCVKREIIDAIAKTLHELAAMQEVKLDPKEVSKDAVLQHRRFKNNTWEIDLLFEQNGGNTYISSKGTIKNIDPAKRILPLASPRGGIWFVLEQEGKEYSLEIKGEPLPWNMATEFNKDVRLIDNIDPTRPFAMEQMFDWSNCPVRRIDEIRIAVHSHRTAAATQLLGNINHFPPPRVSAQPPGMPGAQGSGPSGAPSVPPTRPGGPSGMPAGTSGTSLSGMLAPGGEPFNPVTEVTGLVRPRYLGVNSQCRQVPLGIVLVLEQDHIHNVLTNLTSSQLRFQITQVQLLHVHGVQPQGDAVGNDPGKPNPNPNINPAGPPARKGGRGPGRVGARPMPPPGGPMPPMGPTGRPTNVGGPQGTAVAESDPNLVELCIYGVASLYERYSEKSQPAPSGDPNPKLPPAQPKPQGPPPPK